MPVRLRAREHVLEPLELALATDESRFQAVPAARPPRREHAPELPAGDTALLPFRRDRPRLAELERAADEGRGALPHHYLAGLRRLFEARCDVDGVAGRERAALARAADRDLAGIDADPQREPAAEELLQPLLHPQGDLQGALGVVLLCGGRAEHGDDSVADELLDRSAAERDLRFHRVVETLEQVACVLRVERRAQLRRADEVGEQDRRELALHRASICRNWHKSDSRRSRLAGNYGAKQSRDCHVHRRGQTLFYRRCNRTTRPAGSCRQPSCASWRRSPLATAPP